MGQVKSWGWSVRYCNAHKDALGHWDYDGASNLAELNQQIRGVYLRRTKAEVLPQLPVVFIVVALHRRLLEIRFIRSTCPLVQGWLGFVRRCSMP